MSEKKPRVSWKSEAVDKAFLEACLDEVTINGREGTSLKGCSWKVVGEKLKNEHNFIVDRAQMKNRYDYIKKKFVTWVKLRNKTGNLYNPVTNTFSMSDEEWVAEGKLDKYVEKLRNAPLICPDLCIKLFEGVVSTGVHCWGPSSTIPHPAEEFSAHDMDEDHCTQMETDAPHASDESSGRSKHHEGQGNSKRVRRNTFDDDLREVGKEIVNVAKMLVESERLNREKEDDVDACMEKLEKMEWGKEIPDTTRLFCYLVKVLILGKFGCVLRRRVASRGCEMLGGSALDGTLVHAVLPANQQPCFRGRGKGECYQNVLGICDFDMIFTYVWAGWEGIAHDSRVLKEIASNPTFGFRFPPPGKYYLCDAAYTNTRGFLAPYRNTRYWLADFRRRRALTKEERFNHAHAQLRNVIERAYGVLKARFPILKQMAPYPFPVQRDVVIACFAVHNFIRKYNIQDELFMDFEETTMATPNVQGEGSEGIEWGSEGVEYMTTLRNQIANQLFSSASS
ncbi:hypothetical protein SSX86_024964 [Deinandra increscens subsp. villosa]|uniref:Myb/SANT-like domain-containing protein n=1 Tax=Deinandra increscens subsp. villosa TaxID=3103831 RepID=A0AAP0CIJ4_9ASTR